MSVTILQGDCRDVLATLPAESFNACVCSPPYFGLRSYLPADHPDKAREIGLEATPDAYVKTMVGVFREVRRVLRDDGVLWLNIGDSYAGSWGSQGHRETPAILSRNSIRNHPKRASHTGSIRQAGLKPKDLIGIPWMLAFALRSDGWWLRGDHVWGKPNGMPESTKDRPTRSHEYVFLLTKSERYWFDAEAVRTAPKASSVTRLRHQGFNDRWDEMERNEQMADGANLRSIWWVSPAQYREAHFAVMPDMVAEICIRSGSPAGGHVLDPFGGAGTTGLVADRLSRNATLIELNPANPEMAKRRIEREAGMFAEVA